MEEKSEDTPIEILKEEGYLLEKPITYNLEQYNEITKDLPESTIKLIDKELQEQIERYNKHPFMQAKQLVRERTVPIHKIGKSITLINPNVPEEEKTTTEAIEEFSSIDILDKIKLELDKTHLIDDSLKMTAFLVAISGLLKIPKKRMSMAFTGDSSVGKDNVMKTALKHMPNNYLFLTGATKSAIEDEACYVKILALSEMNLFKEGGANKDLLEVVKQRTEGGTESLKKDVKDSFKTTKHERTEQGTVFYGTTDAERNAETETRFIFGHVGADPRKIKAVNMNTAEKESDLDQVVDLEKTESSWIKKGLCEIVKKYGHCLIFIPYAKFLMEKEIIDNQNPRSMRDFKRLLALTWARTFLSAPSRKLIKYKGQDILVSKPQDFLDVVRISQEFFNQTYSGMDERLNGVLKILDSNIGDWTARDYIQRLTKVTLNTIKSRMSTLEKMNLVEWKKGVDLNFQENVKNYDGNKIYYKRCHKGIKIPLIRYQYSKLKEIIKEFNLIPFKRKGYQNKGINSEKDKTDSIKNLENSTKTPKIDTFELTPFEDSGVKEILEDE